MQKLSKKKNLLVFILALGLILFFISQSNFFSIKKVEVFVTNRLDCANQTQLKDSVQLLGKNIFFINIDDLSRKVKEKFFCVKNISLAKNLFDKVEINVSGREPAAYLLATPSAQEATSSFLIDDEGVVFSMDINNLTIPTVFVNITNFSLGQKLERGAEIAKILDKIKTYGLDGKISVLEDNSFIIQSNPKVIFSLERNIDKQLASLQLILNKAKINRRTVPTEVGINAEELEFIDLRFDKPVIKIAPKKNG